MVGRFVVVPELWPINYAREYNGHGVCGERTRPCAREERGEMREVKGKSGRDGKGLKENRRREKETERITEEERKRDRERTKKRPSRSRQMNI